MDKTKIIYKKPVIHFHGYSLMKQQIEKRKRSTPDYGVAKWFRESSESTGITVPVLRHIIYEHNSPNGYQDELTRLFAPKHAFTVEWVEIP